MGHRIAEGLELLIDGSELGVVQLKTPIEILDLGLVRPLTGDVPDIAEDHQATVGLGWAEPDRDRKFGAVLAQSVKFDPGAHRPRDSCADVAIAMAAMCAAIAFGY